MQEATDWTAWSATLLGLYILASGIGAWRSPGAWRAMIAEVEASPALQLVAGLLELQLGALVYLANPWLPADLLSCLLKALGGAMLVEALVVSACCDLYAQFCLRSLNHMHRGWALLMLLAGAALALAGMLRF